jgi:hypothetical protein
MFNLLSRRRYVLYKVEALSDQFAASGMQGICAAIERGWR